MHVVFEITKDAELLNQYFALREKTFQRVLKLNKFDGSGESSDDKSDIFIARVGPRVIGGVRIFGCTSQQRLPLESGTQHLPAQLPDLQLDVNGYCQWMRLTLTQETNIPAKELQRDFFSALACATYDLGYRYGFCVSSKIHQRLYKQVFSRIGYLHFGCGDISMENEKEFNDLEHLLCVTDLQPNFQQQRKMA